MAKYTGGRQIVCYDIKLNKVEGYLEMINHDQQLMIINSNGHEVEFKGCKTEQIGRKPNKDLVVVLD